MQIITNFDSPIVEKGSFTWREFLTIRGWNSVVSPTEEQYHNAIFLFHELQKIRNELGKPLTITSGIRTLAYTYYLRKKGIPAALKSAHLEGRAVDLTCPGMKNRQLWEFLRARWPGRMECLTATPTWCHIDTRKWLQKITFKP
jgi:uncharacterized protein YcbK (DUF882 family)